MDDTKIYLVLCEEDEVVRGHITGAMTTVVSHGVGNNTLKNYIMDGQPPRAYNPKRDEIGLYIEVNDE